MRKYQYIIRYDYDIFRGSKESYCTDSFFKFLAKFLILKRKYGMIDIVYDRPERI